MDKYDIIDSFIKSLIVFISPIVMFFVMICFMRPELFNPEYKCINNQKYQRSENYKTYVPLVYTESGLPVECNKIK